MNVCWHRYNSVCEGQKKTFESQFSPSTKWILGIELKLSDLVASGSIYCAIQVRFTFKTLTVCWVMGSTFRQKSRTKQQDVTLPSVLRR